jgi:hypothetical protein
LNGNALSPGDVVVKLIGNDPRQHFVDAIGGMLGDASDDVAQVGSVAVSGSAMMCGMT